MVHCSRSVCPRPWTTYDPLLSRNKKMVWLRNALYQKQHLWIALCVSLCNLIYSISLSVIRMCIINAQIVCCETQRWHTKLCRDFNWNVDKSISWLRPIASSSAVHDTAPCSSSIYNVILLQIFFLCKDKKEIGKKILKMLVVLGNEITFPNERLFLLK